MYKYFFLVPDKYTQSTSKDLDTDLSDRFGPLPSLRSDCWWRPPAWPCSAPGVAQGVAPGVARQAGGHDPGVAQEHSPARLPLTVRTIEVIMQWRGYLAGNLRQREKALDLRLDYGKENYFQLE